MAEDRAIRWQKISIDYLHYAINLTLTLALSAIGYWIYLLRDEDFHPTGLGKSLMVVSICTLAFSAFSGLVCIANRLFDFRGTAERARLKPGAPTKEALRAVGRWTWGLFKAQFITLIAGAILLGAALAIRYSDKLV